MALEEIDRVLAGVRRWKRPGYLEVPRDVVFASGARSHRAAAPEIRPDPAAIREVMTEVIARLNRSRRPVIYAGVEIERFGLMHKLVTLAEKLNLPVVTSMEGKTVFPETHPNFIGIYMGKVGSAEARAVVEGSDCVLMLGALLTDVSTGLFTARVDPAKLISASSEEVTVSPDPRKTLNRHDAKATKGPMFRPFSHLTRTPFRGRSGIPGVSPE
jgi:indolepyruvate decarboxylase